MQNKTEIMLSAMMKHQGLIQWITGWAPAENEGGVSVLLYGRYGRFHICKVYAEQFHKLPDYLQREIPDSAGPAPMDKNAAQRTGIYRDCRPFQIARYQYPGDEEKKRWRFEGVLAVATNWQGEAQQAAPAETKAAGADFDWWKEAAGCTDAFTFDTAVAKADAWFGGDSGNVAKFREAIIGTWVPGNARALARALYRYAEQRRAGDAHDAAKRAALNEYNQVLA